MDERLSHAAQTGDIDALYALISLDPLLFESIDQYTFSQTPLHIAAIAGQTSILMELLNLKPSLIRKLNIEGYSPIHLASIEGQVEIIREFLQFDHDLGLLKGREWRTPLHCAVINGKVEVICELLSTGSSDWLKALTVRKETVLHLASKFDQIDVFEMLVALVEEKKVEEIVNWKDREGNTILHLAAYRKQFLIIDRLLRSNFLVKVVDINMKNGSGLTALDVLRQHYIHEPNNVEIKDILMHVGEVRGHKAIVSLPPEFHPRRSTSNTSLEPLVILEELFKGLPMEKWAKEIEHSPIETRSTLMVVAVLIATVTFQVVLTPVGPTDASTPCYYYNSVIFPAEFPVFLSITNSIGFMTSIIMITILTRRSPLKALLRMAVLSMVGSYLCCAVYYDTHNRVIAVIVAWLMLTILLLQWMHFKIRSLKKVFL